MTSGDAGPPSALHGRSIGGLGGRMLRFRPQLFWQQVLPEQAASSSLTFHFDMATGRNFARLPANAEYAADGALAQAQAKCVPDADADPGEADVVGRALREAATFGDDIGPLQHLLSSCYCTRGSLEGALLEASRRGNTDGVTLLLRAGADPAAQPEGKTALHAACEEGHEPAARRLLAGWPEAAAAKSLIDGRTPLEAARAADLGIMARRLEAYATECAAATAGGPT